MISVCLCDPQPVVQEGLRALLDRSEDIKLVAACNDLDRAVEITSRKQPDIVILDVMLPGRSGFDILEELRRDAQTADLPVLMLTARGQSRDREMAEKAGVSRFMTKPFSNAEVLTAVRDLLYVHRQST